MAKIIIEVKGNTVLEVSTTPDVEILVVDHDKGDGKRVTDLQHYRGVIKRSEGMVNLLSTVQQ